MKRFQSILVAVDVGVVVGDEVPDVVELVVGVLVGLVVADVVGLVVGVLMSHCANEPSTYDSSKSLSSAAAASQSPLVSLSTPPAEQPSCPAEPRVYSETASLSTAVAAARTSSRAWPVASQVMVR